MNKFEGPSQRMSVKISVMLCALLLTACQTHPERPWFDPLNLQLEMQPREEKKVQVVPSETSFALQFTDGGAKIADAEQRAAAAFLKRRALVETDEVFVDFGLFVDTSALATARRHNIAALVGDAGIDPARVRVRANIPGIAENEVNLTVRRYLVTLPGCPNFTSRAGRTFDNRPHSNWGCATASNFGRMVAEPRDIIEGRGETLTDGEAAVLGIQRYRAGMTRQLAVDDTKRGVAALHGVGEHHALDAPVDRIRTALHPALVLKPIEQAAERGLLQLHEGGEFGLGHALLGVERGQHPPLGAGQAQLLAAAIKRDPHQSGDVVDEEPKVPVQVGTFHSGQI